MRGSVPPWFKQVEALGWDWVGRIRNRHEVQLSDGEAWVPGKTLYNQATSTPKALGRAHVTQSNPIACQLVLYKGKPKGRVHRNRLGQPSRSAHSRKHARAQREPWLLGTSLPEGFKLAHKVVKLYALRMRIEEAFRDLKSARFGLSLEFHRAYHLERLQVLLLIATLALRVAWLMGKATELTGQHRHYQANTVKDRVVLSTIFIGLRVIDDPRVILRLANLIAALNSLDEIIQSHCLAE
jgi:Transposase DDE domain